MKRGDNMAKRGRPKIENPRSMNYRLRLTQEEYDELEDLAERNGTTMQYQDEIRKEWSPRSLRTGRSSSFRQNKSLPISMNVHWL